MRSKLLFSNSGIAPLIMIAIVATVLIISGIGTYIVFQPDKEESFSEFTQEAADETKESVESKTTEEKDDDLGISENKTKSTPQSSPLPSTSTPPESAKSTYAKTVVNDKPIELSGNEVLEIIDTHYVAKSNIRLRDNAVLIIRDSLFEHEKDYTFQYSLEASGNSKVIVENSRIANSCTGSLNWNFFDNSRMETNGVGQEDCNIWHLFTDSATAQIRNHRFNGTFCENATGDIEGGIEMEVELCWSENAVVDEELPLNVTDFTFPNENDKNISFNLVIRNSTVDGWGIGVPPYSDITIRNSPRTTVSIIIGIPYRNRTVILEDLGSKTYVDQSWQIADSKLRLINSATFGWEPNAFCCNTVIIRNSNYAASNINSGTASYSIENSTVGDLGTQEQVTMTAKNSRVIGNVVARDDSTITLINTVVEGKIVEEGNGRVIQK